MYNYEQGFLNDGQQQMPMNEQSFFNAGQQQIPINSEAVPNVMMDFPEEQMQQNAQTGYMEAQPNLVPVDEHVTYDLNVPPFEIEDPIMRRQFFRKVFFILLLQNIIALPVIELFIICCEHPISFHVYYAFWLLGFLIFIAMYIYSDYRRYSPVNHIVLIFTTLFIVIQEGIYATFVRTTVALTSQLIVILQFLAMIAYSKQTRFRFTNVNAIIVAVFMSLIAFAALSVISPHFLLGVKMWSASSCIYCVYDMQLMLTGHHGYNIKAEEHVFGAVNIYADIPNLAWRFFRYIVLDHFVRIYEFFKKCCFAEVC